MTYATYDLLNPPLKSRRVHVTLSSG